MKDRIESPPLWSHHRKIARRLRERAGCCASSGAVGIGALTLLIGNGRDNFTLHANLNWRVLAVTIALSVVTGMLFGLAPAIQSTRVDLISALKQTRGGEQRLRLHRWLRVSLSQALAVFQIAISLLLLVAAGLFVRTLSNLNSIALGFNRENLLLLTINARQAGYKDDALMRFYRDLQTRFAHSMRVCEFLRGRSEECFRLPMVCEMAGPARPRA